MTGQPPITSSQNSALKELRKLRRRRERDARGRFVAEGEDLLAAADEAGWPALERFCAAGSGLPGREVLQQVLGASSTLGSGTRAIGVYEQRWGPPAGPLCVYLHGISDPGNVGAVLRSALAFGASSVVLGAGCADPYGPKAVRASMGAIFAVPVSGAGTAGVDVLPGGKLALVPRRGRPISAPLPDRANGEVTILVGAERDGLPAEVVALCDEVRHIPMPGAGDSLNAAMAATVALYELSQRGGIAPPAARARRPRDTPPGDAKRRMATR
jgi:TrmH family RNA methyltransferase